MRNVVLVAFPGVQSLDVAGPTEAFAGTGLYTVELVAPDAGGIVSESGLALVAARALREVEGPVDTLLVAGGTGVREVIEQADVIAEIRRLAASSRRVASVCTGAFLLARAGLLDGRRATTHWEHSDLLASLCPTVDVEPDAIFVRSDDVWTSAGVTAGIDLALAMIEADHGSDIALAVARRLVVFLKRPGGQSQFSAQLANQIARREPLRDLQSWVVEHLHERLTVERLAEECGMSPRNFSRVFRREVGVTPAQYVEQARVDAARRHLEDTSASVHEVARACGFGTAENLRRSFMRIIGTPPTGYRARFTVRERGDPGHATNGRRADVAD